MTNDVMSTIRSSTGLQVRNLRAANRLFPQHPPKNPQARALETMDFSPTDNCPEAQKGEENALQRRMHHHGWHPNREYRPQRTAEKTTGLRVLFVEKR